MKKQFVQIAQGVLEMDEQEHYDTEYERLKAAWEKSGKRGIAAFDDYYAGLEDWADMNPWSGSDNIFGFLICEIQLTSEPRFKDLFMEIMSNLYDANLELQGMTDED